MAKKVVVGMSGGVDSSVAAYLLKEQGYEVIGLFMQNWDPALNGDLADPYVDAEICQAQEDFLDAKAVADELGIELHRVDFVQEYWDKVFKFFLEEYRKARTPNPDILCNKYIKFRAFMDYAFEKFDPDYIAMGHYAQVEHQPVRLIRGLDDNKDQTYFLQQLTAEQLSKTLFPIGHLEKSEVRKIAREQNLATAEKKDSTGICFIGERNFTKFLTSYIEKKPGDILDYETKTKVGTHEGLMFYTIGQRRGMGIGGHKNFPGVKWYVCAKDIENNILYVANSDTPEYLDSNNAIIEDINWLGLDDDTIKSAKFRYRSKDIEITKYEWLSDNSMRVYYPKADAITPGQACVFYMDEYCLGGGTIEEVFIDEERLMV